MREWMTGILLLAFATALTAQYQPGWKGKAAPGEFAETITADELEKHLSIIASEEFEGRETGQEGQKKAAAYIAGVFGQLGLPKVVADSSYYQEIAFTSESWQGIELSIEGERQKHLWDYYAYPSTNSDLPSVSFDELAFLGYGIESAAYNDYEGVDVAGKAILIYDGEPVNADGVSQVSGSREASEWATDWRKKLRLAKEKGVAMVFIIDGNFKNNVAQARRLILNTGLQLGAGEQPEQSYANNIFLSTKAAKKLLGEEYKKVIRARKKSQKKARAKAILLQARVQVQQNKYKRQVLGENVLGFIEGVDEELKDELLILTAHYDHLGRRGDAIYYGANDNGSGTSTILEVAEAFAQAKAQGAGPRRSVLFMLVSGEEKGLLGSHYYAENPLFPLEQTIANINVDMVGRTDEKHEGKPDYIYVIGSDRLSTELHQINETANATYTHLELDYTYNAEDDPNRYYYRSDHYNFAEKGIPAIFYFNGTHADYHRTTDTVDKIQFEQMVKVGKLIFYTAWELAMRDKRIEVDVKK